MHPLFFSTLCTIGLNQCPKEKATSKASAAIKQAIALSKRAKKMAMRTSKLKDNNAFHSNNCKPATEKAKTIVPHATEGLSSKLLKSKRKDVSATSLPASKRAKPCVISKHVETTASLNSLASFATTKVPERSETCSKKMRSAAPKPAAPVRKEDEDNKATKQLVEEARAKDKKRKAHFSKGSGVAASFQKVEQEYSEQHPLKGKLLSRARGKPSADHSFTSEVVFEHIYLHLILSDYLDTEDLARLNSLNMLFEHMCKMIRHMKL